MLELDEMPLQSIAFAIPTLTHLFPLPLLATLTFITQNGRLNNVLAAQRQLPLLTLSSG